MSTHNHSAPTPQAERTTEAAFRSLLRVVGLLRRTMEPYFQGYGISGAQWGVLAALHRAQSEGTEELRLTDLSERMLIRPPSVTTVLDRLLRAGLVSRRASQTDQRAKLICLSAAGRALVQRVRGQHAAQMEAVLGGLNISEQEQLHQLLDRLGDHLRTLPTGEPAGSHAP